MQASVGVCASGVEWSMAVFDAKQQTNPSLYLFIQTRGEKQHPATRQQRAHSIYANSASPAINLTSCLCCHESNAHECARRARWRADMLTRCKRNSLTVTKNKKLTAVQL